MQNQMKTNLLKEKKKNYNITADNFCDIIKTNDYFMWNVSDKPNLKKPMLTYDGKLKL